MSSAANDTTAAVTGALLAGGRSRRMGTDKAFVEWNGRPLWEGQLEKLRAAGCGPLLLSCREEQPFPEMPGVVKVYDTVADCGPLGGVAACLAKCDTPLLAVLGVDLPLVPAGLWELLLGECGEGRGAVV